MTDEHTIVLSKGIRLSYEDGEEPDNRVEIFITAHPQGGAIISERPLTHDEKVAEGIIPPEPIAGDYVI